MTHSFIQNCCWITLQLTKQQQTTATAAAAIYYYYYYYYYYKSTDYSDAPL